MRNARTCSRSSGWGEEGLKFLLRDLISILDCTQNVPEGPQFQRRWEHLGLSAGGGVCRRHRVLIERGAGCTTCTTGSRAERQFSPIPKRRKTSSSSFDLNLVAALVLAVGLHPTLTAQVNTGKIEVDTNDEQGQALPSVSILVE